MPLGLFLSNNVRAKLAAKTPPVTEDEILQCFSNRTGGFLEDTRESNKTTPPTKWFVSETDNRRVLKVVFIRIGTRVVIKTAYGPNPEERRVYRKYS